MISRNCSCPSCVAPMSLPNLSMNKSIPSVANCSSASGRRVLKVAQVPHCLAHLRQGNIVLAADAGQNERFHEIDERQLLVLVVGNFDDRAKLLLAEHPRAQR